MMSNTAIRGTICFAVTLLTANAYAIGGGRTPPSASQYAILEPQTVPPSTLSEERSALVGLRTVYETSRGPYGPNYGASGQPYYGPSTQANTAMAKGRGTLIMRKSLYGQSRSAAWLRCANQPFGPNYGAPNDPVYGPSTQPSCSSK
jgi:hypothetical protein